MFDEALYTPICFATALRLEGTSADGRDAKLLFVHPDDRAMIASALATVSAPGATARRTYRLRGADGDLVGGQRARGARIDVRSFRQLERSLCPN